MLVISAFRDNDKEKLEKVNNSNEFRFEVAKQAFDTQHRGRICNRFGIHLSGPYKVFPIKLFTLAGESANYLEDKS
ncbi:hypothetical protein A7K69_18520 [Parageobacillus thermoglucosidasius]|uniref:Uncharacterized protein n=1 Tax=Parageobacillus thermoglucosidasius TaxID=1426 RepID=A0A1B7KUB8_PARTM|nr:hypothetical protein A7K69_18520 [Parageobacillus thermoglucosidasius]